MLVLVLVLVVEESIWYQIAPWIFFLEDTNQHMLSHIDDDEENECKYVGAEYHPRVFKAADIAVENLIMDGIIEAMAMMDLMS